jgi:hypothetical protein
VDDLAFVFRAQLARQPPGRAAHQAGYLGRVVVHQAARDDRAVLVAEVDRVAGVEGALDAGDAGRQQAGVPLHDGLDRAVVQAQAAVGHGRVLEPEQPGRRAAAAGGGKVGADRAAAERGRGTGRVGDHGGDAGRGRDHRRLHLGGHAADALGLLVVLGPLACLEAAPEPDPLQVGAVPDLGDPLRLAAARVTVVQAVDIGEQDERPGPGDVRDQRREPVVVAEPDLVGGHRVVLVDHRQHTEFEQPVQGALGVAVVRPAHQVVGGQQDLAGADAVPGEGGGVPRDEQALADAGRRLLGGQVAGAPGKPERSQAGRDRPRGHQDDLAAILPAGGQRGGERTDPHPVDLAVPGGQRRGADLDHDP